MDRSGAIDILIGVAKENLDNILDQEKRMAVESAIETLEYNKSELRVSLEKARQEGYKHTFCSMGYTEEDNPYHPDSDEGQAWLSGYQEGIIDT